MKLVKLDQDGNEINPPDECRTCSNKLESDSEKKTGECTQCWAFRKGVLP